MKDFDYCSGCNGLIEAGGDSGCTCGDDYENECNKADERHGFEREEW